MVVLGDAVVSLLQRMIQADREYRRNLVMGKPCNPDDRGIEVGWINEVNPRTARALVDRGLAETVEIRPGQTYIFLGKYDPYDPET